MARQAGDEVAIAVISVFGLCLVTMCVLVCSMAGGIAAVVALPTTVPRPMTPWGVLIPKPTATRIVHTPTATLIPEYALATRTARFEEIDTAQAHATATAAAYLPTLQLAGTSISELIDAPSQYTLDALTADLQPIFGPKSGKLIGHQLLPPTYSSNVYVKNFMARVQFVNPAQTSWTFALIFRETQTFCRFQLQSTRRWQFSCSAASPVVNGLLGNLDISRQGRNLLEMVVSEDVVLAYLNGAYVTSLDTSARRLPGDIQIEFGGSSRDFEAGVDYLFADFTVWALP